MFALLHYFLLNNTNVPWLLKFQGSSWLFNGFQFKPFGSMISSSNKVRLLVSKTNVRTLASGSVTAVFPLFSRVLQTKWFTGLENNLFNPASFQLQMHCHHMCACFNLLLASALQKCQGTHLAPASTDQGREETGADGGEEEEEEEKMWCMSVRVFCRLKSPDQARLDQSRSNKLEIPSLPLHTGRYVNLTPY